jgi:hypothetical protein
VPHINPPERRADRYAAVRERTRQTLLATMNLRARLVEERIEREHADAVAKLIDPV